MIRYIRPKYIRNANESLKYSTEIQLTSLLLLHHQISSPSQYKPISTHISNSPNIFSYPLSVYLKPPSNFLLFLQYQPNLRHISLPNKSLSYIPTILYPYLLTQHRQPPRGTAYTYRFRNPRNFSLGDLLRSRPRRGKASARGNYA